MPRRLLSCNLIWYSERGSVSKTRKGKRERKNEIWEQNLTWTLAVLITSFPILCFVPIFNFARSPCSFLVLVTVGRHYDVRGVFFFGEHESRKKKRTPEYRFRIWSWQKIEVFLQFFYGEGSWGDFPWNEKFCFDFILTICLFFPGHPNMY